MMQFWARHLTLRHMVPLVAAISRVHIAVKCQPVRKKNWTTNSIFGFSSEHM